MTNYKVKKSTTTTSTTTEEVEVSEDPSSTGVGICIADLKYDTIATDSDGGATRFNIGEEASSTSRSSGKTGRTMYDVFVELIEKPILIPALILFLAFYVFMRGEYTWQNFFFSLFIGIVIALCYIGTWFFWPKMIKYRK